MKAYMARDVAYRQNQSLKGLKEIYDRIAKEAQKGKFNLKILICYDWGSSTELKTLLEKDGYIVSESHKQTSPNDGDDFLHISWEE